MKSPSRILIVNDQIIERKGLSSLLNALPSITVIGEAATGEEAVMMAHESNPDIVLFDQELIQKDGQTAIQHIWQDQPNIAILLLSDSDGDDQTLLGFKSDRVWFAQKDAAPMLLAQMIHEMTRKGERVMEPA